MGLFSRLKKTKSRQVAEAAERNEAAASESPPTSPTGAEERRSVSPMTRPTTLDTPEDTRTDQATARGAEAMRAPAMRDPASRPSVRDTDSTAPTLTPGGESDSVAPLDSTIEGEPSERRRRRSSLFRRRPSGPKEKRGSISDSGPFIFAFDPRTGKTVLQKNPHWPNEDSWMREDSTSWAMGSMYGNETRIMG
jgi:hypothetical protein